MADAVYNDNTLRSDLLSGKKIHALFAMALFPGKTYEEVIASDGSAFDMYHKGKTAVFRMIYGGGWEGLADALGIPEEAARGAFESFGQRYKGVEKDRGKTFDSFCSMRQPGGVGSAVIWHDPTDYVESFLKFRRYFTLENTIARALFDLARKPPAEWRKTDIKVQRRPGRIQMAGGAVASALYGAAFGIQAANMRAAANHEIQSPGGPITKAVQRRIWMNRPYGPRAEPFLEKLVEHGDGIALLFARTETAMFHRYVWSTADALLFLKGRVHFHRPDGTRAPGNAGGPSVLIAYGRQNALALRNSDLDGAFVPLTRPNHPHSEN